MLVRAATVEARRRLRNRGFGDLTPLDTLILAQLLRHGDSRATKIAERMGASKQAIQRPLKRIQANGYTQTTTDPGDGRAQLIGLSETGRIAAITALDIAREIDRGWEQMADRQQLASCKELLLSLARALGDTEAG